MEVTDFVNKYKNKILNMAIIILALIIANNIYKSQIRTIRLLKESKDAEIKKNELLVNISQLEKKLNLYKGFINKKDLSSVINTISNIAKDSGIKIITIRPDQKQEDPMYIKYPFSLTVDADNYHALGRFISKLENHPDIYILELATIRQTQVVGQREESKTNKLTVDLKVSTILLKD